MFAKLLSISDVLMWKYFTLLSFRPEAEVARLRAEVEGGRNPKDAKVQLAKEVTARFHSATAAEAAERDFELRARGGVWQKQHREAGAVPHTSIDTAAHWTKSGWHGGVDGWQRHLCVTVAAVWIPLAARLTPANTADSEVAPLLLAELPAEARCALGDRHEHHRRHRGPLVGPAGQRLQRPDPPGHGVHHRLVHRVHRPVAERAGERAGQGGLVAVRAVQHGGVDEHVGAPAVLHRVHRDVRPVQ